MSKIQTIQPDWIVQLFENTLFQSKMKNFIQNFQQFSKNIPKNEDVLLELNTLSQEISGIMLEQISKQSQQKFRYLTMQLGKIQNQLADIKNIVLSEDEKIQLETQTTYFKSKMDFSSILDQDIAADFNELKSSFINFQSKINTFFQPYWQRSENRKQMTIKYLISETIAEKLAKMSQIQQDKVFREIQTFSSRTQKRMDQLSRTLTNVLEMLNEQNSKKQQKDESSNLKKSTIAQTHSTSPPTHLTRQSSLQNLNISKLFTLGRK